MVIGSQVRKVLRFLQEAPKYGIQTNSFEDLYIMVVALCCITIYRHVSYSLVKPKIEARLLSIDPECSEIQVNKCVRAYVGIFWYTFTTLYAIFLFYGHPYIPASFLGGGKCHEITSLWPGHEMTPGIKRFYMTMFAHHIYSFLELLWGIRLRSDFAEMMLHHCVTVSAMMFTYYGNHVISGTTVLIAHNIGDVFINLSKFTRDAKVLSGFKLDLLFVVLFLTWFVPRVVIIGSCVIPAIIYTRNFQSDVYDSSIEPMVSLMTTPDAFVATCVSLIMCLNLYWSVLLFRIGYNKFMGDGKYEVKGDKAH